MNIKTLASIASLATAAALLSQTAKLELPPPFATPSAKNFPKVVPKPEAAALKVPPGFRIEEYAAGFATPRMMILGPGGELLVSDTIRNGIVYVLTNDGKDRKKLIENLDRPFGLALWKDYLYVGEATSLKRYKYDAKAMTAGPGEELVSMKDFGTGHTTRQIAFDRKGEKMFLAVGSNSNVDKDEPRERAAIQRMNPDGTGREFYAEGIRNPTNIHLYPGSDTLWVSVNERDGLGDDLVPDYLSSVKQGGFYGWPYSYYGQNEDPRRKGEKPDLVAKAIVPDLALGAHVAALDFVFYTGNQFPQKFRGGAFVALHGSWNRAKRTGYSVVYVPMRDGKITGPKEDFLTGFMLSPDQVEVWGRPVGLLQMRDGSLLLSDDGGKKIWRISYRP